MLDDEREKEFEGRFVGFGRVDVTAPDPFGTIARTIVEDGRRLRIVREYEVVLALTLLRVVAILKQVGFAGFGRATRRSLPGVRYECVSLLQRIGRCR